MKSVLEGLNGSNPAAQLTWLVLRVVGQLSPCSRAALVERISGEQGGGEAVSGIVSSVLSKLEEFGFLKLDGDQVAITEAGRQFVAESADQNADFEDESESQGRVAALKALALAGFARVRGAADRLRQRVHRSEENSGDSPALLARLFRTRQEDDGWGGVKGADRPNLAKMGAAAVVVALVAGGLFLLPGSDSKDPTETLLVSSNEQVPDAPADASAPLPLEEPSTPQEEISVTPSEPSEPVNEASAPAEPNAAPAPPVAEPSDLVGSPLSNAPQSGTEEGDVPAAPDGTQASLNEPQPTTDEPAPDISAAPSAEADGAAIETPADAGTADPAAAPTGTEGEFGAVQDSAAVEAAPVDPVVTAIRERIADPELRKKVAAEDLAALEAFYGERTAPVFIAADGVTANAEAALKEIADAESWGLSADAFRLPSASEKPEGAEPQAKYELDLAIAVLKYARLAGGGRLTPARVSPLFDQNPQLPDPKAVLTETAASAAPADYLQSLHPRQEQFQRLRKALLKARAGKKRATSPEIQLIVINMERWRWMPDNMGSLHVWNNVPEFSVRVMKGGKTIYSEKAIVGQRKYPTPIFSAPMRSINFHPDWVVPETIIREDLKPNLVKGGFFGGPSTAVLRQHNLKVSFKGQPVEADSVDWRNAKFHQYTFRQPAGPENVLGTLKFNFPNKHAVYMHDTPQRSLFDQSVRTLSHGCIRVREPDRLASLLLAEDKGWSSKKVKSLLAADQGAVVPLSRPLPVHLTYFTAIADDKGAVETFADIYGLDTRMSAALFSKPVKFNEPVVEAKSEWTSGGGSRAGRTTIGGLAGEISGLFSN
jgi:murein L,D-transpeptidase YcbB/YkuD